MQTQFIPNFFIRFIAELETAKSIRSFSYLNIFQQKFFKENK